MQSVEVNNSIVYTYLVMIFNVVDEVFRVNPFSACENYASSRRQIVHMFQETILTLENATVKVFFAIETIYKEFKYVRRIFKKRYHFQEVCTGFNGRRDKRQSVYVDPEGICIL